MTTTETTQVQPPIGERTIHNLTAPPWTADSGRYNTPDQLGAMARQVFNDPYHMRRTCYIEGRLGRENCGACVLGGYEPRGGYEDGYKVKRDGPNYAGWARMYVEARRMVPANWRDAFTRELNSDNHAYADALARSVVTFGVAFTDGERVAAR